MPGKRPPVNRDQAERRRVAECPLEVVQQRPVEIAPHIDSFNQTSLHLTKGRLDERNPPLVVRGRDPALRDKDRKSTTDTSRPAHRPSKRLGVILIPHLPRHSPL